MKMLKSIFVIILGVLIAGAAYAQLDEKRMDRDLKVASGALNSLLSLEGEGNEKLVIWGNQVEGSYIEDYGAIFYVPRNTFLVGYAPKVNVGRTIGRSPDVPVVAPTQPTTWELADPENGKSVKEKNENTTQTYKTFLADYGMLIGQLKPGQKIMVTEKSSESREIFYINVGDEIERGNSSKSQVSAEILVSDINSFKQGKISRDQLLAKVDITVSEKKSEVVRDFEIFANMIKTAFSSDLTESYWTSWKPAYRKLENVGVVFRMQVYSSFSEDQGYRMPSLGLKNMKESERKEKVKELYPVFLEDLKSSIVQYGRTLSSLEENELVMFKVKMTKCDGCGIPDNIEISVKKSVLTEYGSGKLSLDAAMKSIKVQG